jgi:hypothetical protein
MGEAAVKDAKRRGWTVWPHLSLDLVSRGLALGRRNYSTAIRRTSLGAVNAVTRGGGWSEIKYGSGIESNSLLTPSCSVDVIDTDGELIDLLETYDPRGSAARIDWGASDSAESVLLDSDWWRLFTGILSDWSRDEPVTRLMLKVDDSPLRNPLPSGIFKRAISGSAEDASICGTPHPLVMGIFDSLDLTARGAVPMVNVRYDKDTGYWWVLSADRMVSIDRLYFNGAPQTTGWWTTFRGVYGDAQLTFVSIASGYQPKKDTIVSVDCHGPDENGDSVGDTLTGAPDQLRAVMEEFCFRRPPLTTWRGPSSAVDSVSAAMLSEFFALHRCESARVFGGDQGAETIAETMASYLESHPPVRIQWNEYGQIEFLLIDPDDVEPDATKRLDLALYDRNKRVQFEPGDMREVYTHLRMPYCYLPSDQKFSSAAEAHDVAALPAGEVATLVIENPWTQARLFQDLADLNPQPPADPTP